MSLKTFWKRIMGHDIAQARGEFQEANEDWQESTLRLRRASESLDATTRATYAADERTNQAMTDLAKVARRNG